MLLLYLSLSLSLFSNSFSVLYSLSLSLCNNITLLGNNVTPLFCLVVVYLSLTLYYTNLYCPILTSPGYTIWIPHGKNWIFIINR